MTAMYEKTAGTYDPNGIIACNAHRILTKKVTIASGEGKVSARSIMGIVTTNKKYRFSLAASNDGSEVPSAILTEDVDATSSDVEAIVYYRGDFREERLIYGTGHDADSVKAALGTDSRIELIGEVK